MILGYDNRVKTWSRKLLLENGILFELDNLFIPINMHRIHWMMVNVVSAQEQIIQSYDSLNWKRSPRPETFYMKPICNYLCKESLSVRSKALNDSERFKLWLLPNVPK